MSRVAEIKFSSIVLENSIKSEQPTFSLKSDQRQFLQNLTEFNSFMKSDGSSVRRGVIGSMASNGLRSDSWVHRVDGGSRQKILDLFSAMSIELQKSSLIQSGKYDVTDAKTRNELINKLTDLYQSNAFESLSQNDQRAAVSLARMLSETAALVSSQRNQSGIRRAVKSVDVDVVRSLPKDYTSPIGNIISETAQRSTFWHSTQPTHMCQKSVTTILHKALKTAERATAENPILAAQGKVYEKGYGLIKVEGATFEDVQRAPIGSVVLYDNPNSSAKNGAHAAIKVDGSSRGWVSDFRHDAYVYGKTPPKSLKFYLYIPKDSLDYFSKLT